MIGGNEEGSIHKVAKRESVKRVDVTLNGGERILLRRGFEREVKITEKAEGE